MREILEKLSAVVEHDGKANIVNVDRDNVLDCAFRLVQRRFKPQRPLSVRFTDEDGVDSGGLTREFMRLTMQAMEQSVIFHGAVNARFIRLEYSGICRKHYISI